MFPYNKSENGSSGSLDRLRKASPIGVHVWLVWFHCICQGHPFFQKNTYGGLCFWKHPCHMCLGPEQGSHTHTLWISAQIAEPASPPKIHRCTSAPVFARQPKNRANTSSFIGGCCPSKVKFPHISRGQDDEKQPAVLLPPGRESRKALLPTGYFFARSVFHWCGAKGEGRALDEIQADRYRWGLTVYPVCASVLARICPIHRVSGHIVSVVPCRSVES